ncbi:MAG: site-specific integrase [Lachnospiraceae bacterium]|nr:site-specific integrase [Ruminococcus sp.]MCM1275796.1 site-specific integrase [Lachnospiraceae bacterium]
MANAKKLPSGNWRVQKYVGRENGKRIYKSFTAETRKEAEYQAAKFAATKQDVCRSEITLDKAMENYIDSKNNIISPSTLNHYRQMRRTLSASVGGVKIKNITQEWVQKWVNDLAKTRKEKTCRNYHGFLAAVLKDYRPELVLRTTLPPKTKKDIYVPDKAEVEEIAKIAKGTPIYIPFLLATQCGLRASEISGLELKNVHEDFIEITQARVRGEKGKNGVLKQPKSVSGYRKIPIDKWLYDTLLENAVGERVYPFPSSVITNAWGRFRKRNNLDTALNFHALRHHFASKCLLLPSMPQKYIAELMGHKDTAMIERVYQHTFPSAKAEFAELLRHDSAAFFEVCNTKSNIDDEKPLNKAV